MSENYIVINGKKAELTEEQLEKLGIKPGMSKYEEMFERETFHTYYYVNARGAIDSSPDGLYPCDEDRHRIGNYCTNKDVMKQRALHETLNRLLWRASVIAGELDNEWDGHNWHYYIQYIISEKSYYVTDHQTGSKLSGTVYFPTEESAKDAFENIVNPFMKEHPDFVW